MRAAWSVLVLLGVACAETASGPLAGASDAWKNPSAPAPSLQPPSPVWELYAQLRLEPHSNSAPFLSLGHQPEQQVDVVANELARPSYAALVTDTPFADGALLAELSHGRSGHNYVMLRTGGAWTYLELDSRGSVLASGALAACAACHAQAAADHVFGLPRAP